MSRAELTPVKKWVWLVLAALIVAGVSARIGAVVVLKAWEHPSYMEHGRIARSLEKGDGFRFTDWDLDQTTSVQSPPYPFLLWGLYETFGPRNPAAHIAAMVINAGFGGLAVWLTFLMARRLGGGPGASLIAAAMVALWPTQVYAATVAQALAIITAAVVAVIWLWYKSLDTGHFRWWIMFGVFGCLGALTEPVLLPPMFFAGLLVLVWPSQLTIKRRFAFATVLLVCGLSILGPWTLRNYFVHEKLMPVKSTFWVNMWKGNNPHATGTDRLAMSDLQEQALGETDSMLDTEAVARDPDFDGRRQYDKLTDDQRRELRGKPEVEREEVFGKWAKTWISENPGKYAELCGKRLLKTFWIDWDNPKSHNPINVISRAMLLAMAAIGLVLALVYRWRLGWPAVVLGLAVLTYTLTITAARFLIPMEPLLFALSGLTLAWLVDAIFGKSDKEAVA